MQRRAVQPSPDGVADAVLSNPGVIAGAVAALLVVLLAVYGIRRFRRPMGRRFVDVLADHEAVTVLMHPNPDPDAMAAAIGVASLADQVGTEATLQYSGQIRHQENRAFRTVLDLDFERVGHVSDVVHEGVVLVDHNTPRGFGGAGGLVPDAVVDHHPGEGAGEQYTDVRTDYGACSSIVAEYLEDVEARPVAPDRHASEAGGEYAVPSTVATGLLYGILADTKHLTVGASAEDFRAASFLSPGIDEDLLDRIANPQVSTEVLEVKARAIAGREVRGSFAVSHVGELSNVDAVPQAADELIRLEGVTAVVVCGERDGTVYLSGRSRDDRVHMGEAIENAVEGVTNASAGGHARMGGGQIRTEELTPDGGEGSPSPVVHADLVDRLFRTMAGDV
jgi:nanoRNase/pAp phosphatase (c-di-AMP/oligoRNAs hydrolase)